MKKILFSLFLFPIFAHAGTWTTLCNNGTVTFSSSTFIPAIALDSSTYGGTQSGSSPYTFNLTIGSNSNRLIVVGCSFISSDSASAITVGGVSMTLSTSSVNSVYGTQIWSLVAPGSGSQVINVTTTSGIMDRTHCAAQSYSGAAQSSPIDVAASTINVAGVVATTLTTSQNNEAIFDVIMDGNAEILTPGAGQTAIMNTLNGSAAWGASQKLAPTIGNYQMSWTAVSTPAVLNAVAIKPGP